MTLTPERTRCAVCRKTAWTVRVGRTPANPGARAYRGPVCRPCAEALLSKAAEGLLTGRWVVPELELAAALATAPAPPPMDTCTRMGRCKTCSTDTWTRLFTNLAPRTQLRHGVTRRNRARLCRACVNALVLGYLVHGVEPVAWDPDELEASLRSWPSRSTE